MATHNDRRLHEAMRRQFLYGIGAGGAAAMAGCIGDGDDTAADGTTDDDDDDGPVGGDDTDDGDDAPEELVQVDQVIRGPSQVAWGEEEENMNNWAPVIDHYPDIAARFMMTEMGYEHPQTLERVNGIVTDWEYDDYEIRAEFHEDAYYSNGDIVDPADFAYSLYNWNLVWGLEMPHGVFGRNRPQVAVEDFEVDGRTLIMKSPNGYFSNLYSRVRDPASYFWNFYVSQTPWAWANYREINEELWYLTHEIGLWHPDDKPVATDDQMDRARDIQRELFTHRLPIEDAITNGPFKYDHAGESEIHLVPHDGWPWSDQINWEGVHLRWMNQDQTIHAGLESDQLDIVDHINTPPHVAEAFPDHMQSVQTPTDNMDMLVINQNHNWFDDRRVRQALAYAIDRAEIAQTVHQTARAPVDWQQMVAEETIRWDNPPDYEHLGHAIDDFENYRQDQDRAVSLLQDAGFERDGDDNWLTPDGDEWSFSIVTSEGNTNFEQSIASAFDRFGIDTSFFANEEVSFGNSFWNGEYDTARYPAGWFRRNLNNIWHGTAVDHDWNNAFGPFGDVTPILDDLEMEPNPDGSGNRYVATDARRGYDDLLDLHRDKGIPVRTVEYDVDEPWQINILEWTPDEFEDNDMDPEWLEPYSGQFTARLTVEAPPVGQPDGNLLEWAPEFPQATRDYPITPPDPENEEELEMAGITAEEAWKMEELGIIGKHWVSNYTVPSLPVAWHTNQGFVNTADWNWDEQYITGPQHFSGGDAVSQLALTANPDGRASQ